jgi:hypothetical protein
MTLPWSDRGHTLDEDENRLLDRQWLTVSILWGSHLAALAAYVVIANIRGSAGATGIELQPGDPAWKAHAIRYVLGVMSLGFLIAAYVIRRAARNPNSRISHVVGAYFAIHNPKSRITRAMGLYVPTMIVAWAPCASIGLFGLINFFVEGQFLWLYIFVGVSAVALIALRARKQDVIELAVSSKSIRDS